MRQLRAGRARVLAIHVAAGRRQWRRRAQAGGGDGRSHARRRTAGPMRPTAAPASEPMQRSVGAQRLHLRRRCQWRRGAPSARTSVAPIRATPITSVGRRASARAGVAGIRGKGFRDDLMSSVRFHRILRRGREYGPRLSPETGSRQGPPDDPERGLHFICLNANISRQFEFVQNAWMMNGRFSGLTGESDPLIGNREAGPTGCPVTGPSRPDAGDLRRRIAGMPQFVSVRGGAYFFLPGLRALRYRGGWRCLVPSRSSYPAKSRRRPPLALAARARHPRRARCRRAR